MPNPTHGNADVPAPNEVSPPELPKKSGVPSWLKRSLATLLGIAVVAGGLAIFNNLRDTAGDLKVGACVVREGENGVKEAPCTDSGALKILQKLDDTLSDTGCAQSTQFSYTQELGSDKFVLCLGPPT